MYNHKFIVNVLVRAHRYVHLISPVNFLHEKRLQPISDELSLSIDRLDLHFNYFFIIILFNESNKHSTYFGSAAV